MLCIPWTKSLVIIVKNLYAHAQNHLRMLTVPKSEAEICELLIAGYHG